MKKVFNKIISAAIAASMTLGSMTFAPATAFAASFTKIGGWNETLYAELSGLTDSDVTSVSYNGAMSGSLTGDDLTYLVRDNGSGGVRIDIPGLKPGDYTLTVNGTTSQSVNVPAQDRSGYAHYNYTDGVGAYNDDGTLKANAKVIYVTDENKDTVSVTSSDGTTVTGIGHILNSSGQQGASAAEGLNSKGGIANNNQGIIKKLAQDGTPLVVRFIGSVNPPDGLTAYDSVDYGGSTGDNGYMARIQSGKDVTLEGIGNDAEINGWGFHYICQSSNPELGKSCEVKNLSFWSSPEDSFGAEGVQEGSTITASVERIWVHNCSFLPQTQSQYAESDKKTGDGCCDFKRGQYMTMSYCYFYNAHKTNLVGSADSCLQYNITWHHNMWENCEARGPLGRQANMHIYNNYYLKQSSYAMNPRANCYIFSEYNTMEYCKNPMDVTSGGIKSYNDTILCCSGAQDGTIVTDKNAQVSTSNKYANFDTNSSLSYIPSGNYNLQESAAEAKKTCLAYAGVQKENVIDESSVDSSVITPSNRPTNSVELPFNATYGKGGENTPTATGYQVVANVVYNATKVSNSGEITIRGEGIVFSLAQEATVTMTGVSGSYVPVLSNSDGKIYITGSGTAVLPAGVYVIQSSGFDAGSQAFKEAKIASLSMTATNPGESVSTTTYVAPVTEATTQSAQTTTASQTEEETETTTVPVDPSGAASMGTYVFGKNASGGDFNIKTKNDTQGNVSCDFRDMTTEGAKTRYEDGYGNIDLTLNSDTNVTITSTGKGIVATNVATNETVSFATGTVLEKLPAATYNIQGIDAKNNSAISKMVLASPDSSEPATEVTSTTPVVDPVTDTVAMAVGTAEAKVGATVKIPVTLTGVATLGLYSIAVSYNSAVLTPASVENGDILTQPEFEYNTADDGSVEIAAVNAAGTVNTSGETLCYVNFTVKAAGSANLTLTVNDLKYADETDVTLDKKSSGKVTATEEVTPQPEPSGSTPTDTIMWDMTNLVAGDNSNGLELGEAMPYKEGSVTIGEYTFAGQAQGTTNPTITDGIPTAGAYYKFTAPSDGKFTVAYAVSVSSSTGESKTVQIFGETNSTAGNYVTTYDVTAGTTYYIFGASTKVITYYLGFTPSAVIPGDVNNDGKVNSADAVIVLRVVAGIDSAIDTTKYNAAAADCDGKEGITLLDVVWILTHRSSSDEPKETTTEATTETSTETSTESTTEETSTETSTEAQGGDEPAPSSSDTWNAGETASWVALSGSASSKAKDIIFTDNTSFSASDNIAVAKDGSFTVTTAGAGTIKIYMSTASSSTGSVDTVTGSDGTATITSGDISVRGSQAANIVEISVNAADTYTITLTGGNSDGFAVYRIVRSTSGSAATTSTTETTTETTTTTTTETTTTTTTETSTTTTEATTESQGGGSDTPVSNAVSVPYSITFGDDARAKMTTAGVTSLKSNATLDNIEYNLNADFSSTGTQTCIKVKTDGQYVKFTVDQSVDLVVTIDNSNRSVNIVDESGNVKGTISTGDAKAVTLEAGTYKIVNATTSEAQISYISISEVGSAPVTETEASSEPTTSTTTTTTEATTTTTTEAQGGGDDTSSGYVHNFTTDGTTSSFYTISGNLSTSKGTVSYNNLTLTQCLKMESSTSITFTATSSGKLILVFVETAPTIKIDGTKYTGTSQVMEIDLAAGSHTIAKADTANLFYMSFGGSGAVVEPSSQTTTSSGGTDTPSGGDTDLTNAVNVPASDTSSLKSAISSASAGKPINLAAGTYTMSSSDILKLSKSGTSSEPIVLTCSSGEAVLDFSAHSESSSNRGLTVSGDYVYISNIRVKGAGDNGMFVTGKNITVENCVFEANHDTGLQVKSTNDDDPTSEWPENILIKNCTSYNNMDDKTQENADGFAAKLAVGKNVVFDSCIAYCNSDDGWDLYSKTKIGAINPVTIKNCVAFANGKLTDGTCSPTLTGDMNGFKLGGEGLSVAHVVENCIAFNNGAYGFTDNNNPGLASLTNCTSYNNGSVQSKSNYGLDRATDGNLKLTGVISYGALRNEKFATAAVTDCVFYNSKYYKVTSASGITQSSLSSKGTAVTPSDSDFVSMTLPYTDLSKIHTQMRNTDGSIKLNGFLQPKSGGIYDGMGAVFAN